MKKDLAREEIIARNIYFTRNLIVHIYIFLNKFYSTYLKYKKIAIKKTRTTQNLETFLNRRNEVKQI